MSISHGPRGPARAVAEPSVATLVEEACRLHAGRVAVRAADGDRTFAQVWRAARSVAAELRRQGVHGPEFVGVWAVKTADLLAGVLGVLAAGAVYVPLDPTYGHARLSYIVSDAEVRRVVAPAGHADAAAVLGLAVTEVPTRSPPSAGDLPVVDAGRPAYLIYTSGSTGRPKGVVVEHRSVVNLLQGMLAELRLVPGDVLIGTAPIAFDASVPNLLLPLIAGATLCLPPPEVVIDPHALAALIEDTDATVLKCSNSVLGMLRAIAWPGRPGLKVVTGGESLPPAIARWLLPLVDELWNQYGPTETTVCSTHALVTPDDIDPVPIGWDMPGVEHLVLGPDLSPVGPGEIGELWISGAGVARGYLHDARTTAEKFIELTAEGGDPVRGYRTGDMVRERPDGALMMLGRSDEQVKVRGYRIELPEIDHRLAEHPDIEQAVTVVNRNDRGDARLVAFVRTREGDLHPDEVKRFARELLPGYMAPSLIVPVDSFPLTSGGKIDRRALAERPAHLLDERTATLITDPLERRVARLYAKVLGIPVGQIAGSDDFFALGGESIGAVELIGLVGRELKARLAVSTLMTSPTVEGLAAAVRRARAGVVTGPLVKLRDGDGVALFLIHDVGGEMLAYQQLVAALPEEQTVYGLQMVGVDRAVPVLRDVHEMVDRYLAEVRAVWPSGPYVFGGFSFGGLIAYLMAVRLAEVGQETMLVALLDSTPPRRLYRSDPGRRGRRWRYLIPTSTRVGHAVERLQDRVWRSLAVRFWLQHDRVLPAVLHNTRRILFYAMSKCDPIPSYDGRVVQWWGDHDTHLPTARMTAVWNMVVQRGVEVNLIAGPDIDHEHFLKDRSGQWVADGLAREIARGGAATGVASALERPAS